MKIAYVYDWIEPATEELLTYLEEGYQIISYKLWEADAGEVFDMRYCAVLVKKGEGDQ